MKNDGEIHLIVLWEKARVAEERILADIPKHVEVVRTLELEWPGDAATAFQEFYGTYLPSPERKVRDAGAGKFLCVVVRDKRCRYAFRRTERGMERLNELVYQMKRRYREWIGGSHIVHASNSVEEARHDLWLLTSIPYEDWQSGAHAAKSPRTIPGRGRWESLRDAFETLNRTMSYVVLRGYDHLPDNYVRERDTDIDVLCEDCRNAAWILHARKVYPHLPYRPHYEIDVAGSHVRLDLRYIGDGYYCEAWERDILKRRVKNERGFYTPGEEDALPSLAYHALLQKKVATPNLCKALRTIEGKGEASAAGLLDMLGRFMSERGYRASKPKDTTVYFNAVLDARADLASEARDLIGVEGLSAAKPPRSIPAWHATLPKFAFTGTLDGELRRVEYSPRKSDTFDTQFRSMQAFYLACPEHALRPVTWRMAPSGAYLVSELADGETLADLMSREGGVVGKTADAVARAFVEISDGLRKADVVHRDVRPENVLVTRDGRIVLTGFDMAILRKGYKKEKKFVRKHFRAMMEGLGEDYVFEPGKWEDVKSLLKILEKLPKSDDVDKAKGKLTSAKSRPLKVRAPGAERISSFFRWIGLSLKGSSKAKDARKRAFAKNAAC